MTTYDATATACYYCWRELPDHEPVYVMRDRPACEQCYTRNEDAVASIQRAAERQARQAPIQRAAERPWFAGTLIVAAVLMLGGMAGFMFALYQYGESRSVPIYLDGTERLELHAKASMLMAQAISSAAAGVFLLAAACVVNCLRAIALNTWDAARAAKNRA